jgi:hypothetical protein
MNKKFIAIATSIIMLSATGCGKNDEAVEVSVSVPETSDSISETQPVTQPDPDATDEDESNEEDSSEQETSADDNADDETSSPDDDNGELTTEAVTEASEETTSQEYTVAQDENGAVIFDVDDEVSDEELIAAAQTLFDTACEVNWNYHVGCPYNLDYNTTAENEFGWQFYLITNPEISSLADVEADYYKVFSDAYPNDLSEIFIESDGKVYALAGERGMNIFYEDSVVTAVTKRSDTEIFFNVENSYSGDDYNGDGEYTEDAEFSVVISDDGTWRAGLFTLPY